MIWLGHSRATSSMDVVRQIMQSLLWKLSILLPSLRLRRASWLLKWTWEKHMIRLIGLSWNLLSLILEYLQILLILSYRVQGSSLFDMLNGSKLEGFTMERGFWQGDPLSPYLFIMCMERLAISIQDLVTKGVWEPIHISKRGLSLSHLLFTNDMMLFCRAFSDQAKVVVGVLDQFCEASRLRINLAKSIFICSKGVPNPIKGEIMDILGIRCTHRISKYLGSSSFLKEYHLRILMVWWRKPN